MKNFNDLIRVKRSFNSQYKKHDYIYLYIAPKDRSMFDKFISLVKKTPSLSGSLYEILSENSLVKDILYKNFPQDIELDIYIASDDRYSSFTLKGTLKDYIKQENISFDY